MFGNQGTPEQIKQAEEMMTEEQIKQSNERDINYNKNSEGDTSLSTETEAEKLLKEKQEFCKISWEDGREEEIGIDLLEKFLENMRTEMQKMETSNLPEVSISLMPNTQNTISKRQRGTTTYPSDFRDVMLNDIIIASFENQDSYYSDKLIEFSLGISASEFFKKYTMGISNNYNYDYLDIKRKQSANNENLN